MNWQPAETAPKDGTEILAWAKELGGQIVLYWTSDGVWTDGYTKEVWTVLNWQDLPPDPVD